MYLFQLGLSRIRLSAHSNLHSTMYLFQHYMPDISGKVTLIYIPLCIYFNSESASGTSSAVMIYIPLCIYFNMSIRMYCSQSSAIYIPLCIYFNRNARRSSIQSWINLHSTMYLFQLFNVIVLSSIHRIYIPLCIYFNQSRETVPRLTLHLHSTMYLFQPEH